MKDPDPLLKAVDASGKLLIVMHNNPDPDSFGAALALQYLLRELKGIESTLGYGGIVGRAENRKFIELLDIKASQMRRLDLRNYRQLAMVDAQPAAGNHAVPKHRKFRIVLDHHPELDNSGRARFIDVDESYAAASALLADYLFTAGLHIPTPLATALCYGIKTDTMELTRGASDADIKIYMKLYQLADKLTIGDIMTAHEPIEYYQVLADALQRAVRLDDLVVVLLDEVPYADVVAEVADFFLRLDGITCTTVTGYFEGEMVASIRSVDPDNNAGTLVKKAMGVKSKAGGHAYAAGGRKELPDDELHWNKKAFLRRLLKYLDMSGRTPTPLLESHPPTPPVVP